MEKSKSLLETEERLRSVTHLYEKERDMVALFDKECASLKRHNADLKLQLGVFNVHI